MAKPTQTDRGDAERDEARCISAADRTAFALGHFLDEADEARRAAISRHLLRCPACRAEVDAISMLGSRLSTFGSGGDWEADLGAALAAERGRGRVRRRAALSGVAAAAGVVVALAVGLGRDARSPASDAGPVVDSTARASTAAPRAPYPLGTALSVGKLLAAQAADGRFPAAAHVGGPLHDEAATGLAVLALVGEGRGLAGDAEATRAVAAAIRWLRMREGGSGRFVPDSASHVRDQAIATAALLEVGAVTGDAATRSSAERAVRVLRADLPDSADDGGWGRAVLARARDLATGRAADAGAAMGDVFVAARWPTGLAEDGSFLGRTLAVVAAR